MCDVRSPVKIARILERIARQNANGTNGIQILRLLHKRCSSLVKQIGVPPYAIEILLQFVERIVSSLKHKVDENLTG